MTRSHDGVLDVGCGPRRAVGADTARDGAAQSVEFVTEPAGVSVATRRPRTRDRPPYATLSD
ncbi:hypothetical protein D320_20879 [Haloferax sp. BAB-2207]|uniref:hypothetical protein n=1 Tax=Haloferax volcanii TaxID=2246 RepID=UPI0002A4ED41|nr:hypothetical protein [Haloferax sp. BAB-2207]ELK46101.1 hypothetical protein D320_20879 [Haloferax sp. BAB-2207]